MNGFIIRTSDGQDLKEQMKSQMRQQYRTGDGQGNMITVGREYEQGYRDGYREGYEQGMRDDQGLDMQHQSAEQHELHSGGQGKYSM